MNKSAAKPRTALPLRFKATLASFAALTLGAPGLHANQFDYIGGTTGTYGTAGNFYDETTMMSGDLAPGINDDVLFNGTSTNAGVNQAETITLATGAAANSFTFENTGTTGFTGGNLTLGGGTSNTSPATAPGITVASGAGAVTLTEAVIIGASQTWTNSSSNAVNITSGITGAASTGTAASPEILTLSTGGFAPTYVVIANGSGGVLALAIANGASVSYGKPETNTYSGGTNILSGSMSVQALGGFGTGTITLGNTTAATAGAAKFAVGGTATNAFVAQGSGASTIVEATSGQTLTLSGGITLNNTTALELEASGSSGNSGIAVSGMISGSGGLLTAKVAGTNFAATLSGANTYSGGTTVSSGTLNINNGGTSSANSAIGTGTLTINGGTIDNATTGAITLATNNAVTVGGSFTFNGTSALNLGTGPVSLTGTRTITTSSATNALTIGGQISGTATTYGLTKAGVGALVLGAANTYTGPTVLSASGGTLTAAAASALATTSLITINSSATLSLTASNALGAGAAANTAGSTTSIVGTVPITMNAGTLMVAGGVSQGNGSTSTVGIGLLTLTTATTSTISFGTTGSSTLSFSALTAPTTTSLLNVLNDNNMTGMAGVDGSTDRLIFNEALTAAQLADIEFGGVAGSASDISLGNGEYEVLSTVPEPSTWAAGCLSLGVAGFALQKRRPAAKLNGLDSKAA